ncbi:hypothetical protein J1779_02720 [Rahnella sp. FC061912-K]|uniref:hypothetical protein n=1 Tax=Rahnella rivi TaxID=2816249 RepID=UPI001C2563B0|nr:hypothetical protein [Rahnella rivi]MBU9828839.1 hypothetical protein [Rahnella rivi]
MKLKCTSVLIGVLSCAPAFADTNAEQVQVMNYCQQLSVPLYAAASQYVGLQGNISPEEAKKKVSATVTSSTEYRSASPQIKQSMENVVTEIAQPTALAAHQKAMMDRGENYIGMHRFSWAIKTVGPFTAWCNYNHLKS